MIFCFLLFICDSAEASGVVVAMGAAIGWEMIEWQPSGGRVDAIVAVEKGRLRGADVIRELRDVDIVWLMMLLQERTARIV